MTFTELQVTTNYSFLRGASHPEELFATAALQGHTSLAVTDRNTLAGIARAHQRATEANIRLIIGCRLDLRCGTSLLVYPTNRAAYAGLCRLLSRGKARAGKGKCDLAWPDLQEYADGLIAILLPDAPDAALTENLHTLKRIFPNRAYLALTLRRRPGDAARLAELSAHAAVTRIPCVATGDVLYHTPARRILQDVMTCIREGTTIDDAGFLRERFADRHLKTPAEMARLFKHYPEAVRNTQVIADACRFSMKELRYQYPRENPPGMTAQESLEEKTWQGAADRYHGAVAPAVETQLKHELGLIAQLDYAPYFLTVHAIVQFARSEGILCVSFIT